MKDKALLYVLAATLDAKNTTPNMADCVAARRIFGMSVGGLVKSGAILPVWNHCVKVCEEAMTGITLAEQLHNTNYMSVLEWMKIVDSVETSGINYHNAKKHISALMGI